MEITYDYYRTFYYVAKCGSFSAAARAMFKGQPNITKTISNLEAQLGCKLFFRTGRGVSLTPQGEKLFKYAEIAFENLNRAEEELISVGELGEGSVYVAATEISLYGVLFKALSDFNAENPKVKINLTNSSSPKAIEAVRDRLVDFAVVTLYEKPDNILKYTKIIDFQDYLCCKNGYNYDSENVFSSPLVSIDHTTYNYKYFNEFLISMGIIKEPDIEVATAGQMLPFIKNGMAIGFVSEFLANEPLKKGEIEIIPSVPTTRKRSIYFVENKEIHLSYAARKLKEILLK